MAPPPDEPGDRLPPGLLTLEEYAKQCRLEIDQTITGPLSRLEKLIQRMLKEQQSETVEEPYDPSFYANPPPEGYRLVFSGNPDEDFTTPLSSLSSSTSSLNDSSTQPLEPVVRKRR